MEWVETTGKTVQDAIEAALDQLGVDEQDAEVVVLEDGRPGFLGIGRADARVQARVRPSAPRPKRPQRGRRTRGRAQGGERPRTERAERQNGNRREAPVRRNEGGDGVAAEPAARQGGGERRGSGRRGSNVGAAPAARAAHEEEAMPVEQQAAVVEEFVRGVVERFGFTDATTTTRIDEEQILIDVEGSDLGLLIGQRGATLDALQELARTTVQRRSEEHAARIVIDAAGFRAKRTAALATFAAKIADEVVRSGSAEAMEPMSAADRKVVHDSINAISGVATTSEGVEPRRYVVVRPAPDEATSTVADEADTDDGDADEVEETAAAE